MSLLYIMQTVQKSLESRRKERQRLPRIHQYVRMLFFCSNEEYGGFSPV